MLKFDENGETWYFVGNSGTKSYINKVHWNFHPGDPNTRNIFDGTGSGMHGWDHSPLIPVLAVLMLVITVCLLVLFRQNPPLVAGVVAAALIVFGLYLTLSTLQESKIRLE